MTSSVLAHSWTHLTFPGQQVLMPPGLRFKVVGRMNLGAGLLIIRVQQV